MAVNATIPTAVQPALLFMPDISGFTDFVNTTEIQHAQNIIQEVLEVIVDSNQLNLELSEIEGDAVFFYRLGEPPSIEQLLEQVQAMYTHFHQHLKLYDHSRICQCGACTTATNLKLKFVVHFGEVTGYSIKKHQKLFGKDVIILHRLLKNKVNKKEYALLTSPVWESHHAGKVPEWVNPEAASEQYDVGEINFKVTDLSPLYEAIPVVLPTSTNHAASTQVAFIEEKVIPANIPVVFGALIDLQQRASWMDGVKKIEMVTKDSINRIGTLHRCVVNGKNDPIMITESVNITPDQIEMVEMDKNGMAGCRFSVYKLSEAESRVKVEMLLKNKFFVRLMFNMMMKKKYQKSIRQSLENLSKYCVRLN